MKILAIECTASAASAALCENGKILASSLTDVKMKHSATLLPLIENMLKNSNIPFSDIEGLAIAAGPGSFTGVRIGIAALKGLAAPRDLPCVGLSTLLCMAEQLKGIDCIVCPVMDARCSQVYNALFRIKSGKITRLTPDRALLLSELATELKRKRTALPIYVMGDGTDIAMPYLKDIKNVKVAPLPLRTQSAVGVALASEPLFKKNTVLSHGELQPIYLRLPQAERELKAKQNKE